MLKLLKSPVSLVLFFVFLCSFSSAQEIKKENIIIDTDAAPDDLRSICLFLAVPEINILSITTCDGSLSQIDGLNKVNSLLKSLHINGIPTASGRKTVLNLPGWREFCSSVSWSYKDMNDSMGSKGYKQGEAKDLIVERLRQSQAPVTVVELGSLTNLSDALAKAPEIKSKIKKIIWYNDYRNRGASANYYFDKASADNVISSDIVIDNISEIAGNQLIFDTLLLRSIDKIQTKYAEAISYSHHQTVVYNQISIRHLHLWDDLIPVYLLFPDLFDMEQDRASPNHKYCINYFALPILSKILELLSQKYDLQLNITFNIFPVDTDDYKFDVRPVMTKIIDRYGKEEWRACVLTNEIHGHLGVYSIVGAKMGIKARELLQAQVDRITVFSYAQSDPPLGCINDGLQVSTGATLGLGMISFSKDSVQDAAAIFEYKNKRVKIRLKDNYRKQIDDDLNQSIMQYGNLTDGYWKLCRKFGLLYWEQWDRNEIFDIKILN